MLGNRTRWLLAALVVLATVAGVTALLVDDDALSPGFVADGTTGTPPVHEAEVQLPIGVLRLTSGAPVEEIAARRVGRDGDGVVRAADDAVIVPLTWRFSPSVSYDELLAYPTTFGLSVTGGGTRTDLGEIDVDLHESAATGAFPEGSLITVVAGDGDDLGAEVRYEGEAQTVALASGEVDAGRAEPLYPDGPATWGVGEPCDARGTDEARNIDAGHGSIHCRIGPVTRTPYLPDLGWSAAGRVWSVVDVTLTAPRRITWLPTGSTYRVERDAITVTLDGNDPVRAPRGAGAEGTTVRGTWAFDSPADDVRPTLQVAAPMTAVRSPQASGGPATVPFGVDQSFTLRR